MSELDEDEQDRRTVDMVLRLSGVRAEEYHAHASRFKHFFESLEHGLEQFIEHGVFGTRSEVESDFPTIFSEGKVSLSHILFEPGLPPKPRGRIWKHRKVFDLVVAKLPNLLTNSMKAFFMVLGGMHPCERLVGSPYEMYERRIDALEIVDSMRYDPHFNDYFTDAGQFEFPISVIRAECQSLGELTPPFFKGAFSKQTNAAIRLCGGVPVPNFFQGPCDFFYRRAYALADQSNFSIRDIMADIPRSWRPRILPVKFDCSCDNPKSGAGAVYDGHDFLFSWYAAREAKKEIHTFRDPFYQVPRVCSCVVDFWVHDALEDFNDSPVKAILRLNSIDGLYTKNVRLGSRKRKLRSEPSSSTCDPDSNLVEVDVDVTDFINVPNNEDGSSSGSHIPTSANGMACGTEEIEASHDVIQTENSTSELPVQSALWGKNNVEEQATRAQNPPYTSLDHRSSCREPEGMDSGDNSEFGHIRKGGQVAEKPQPEVSNPGMLSAQSVESRLASETRDENQPVCDDGSGATGMNRRYVTTGQCKEEETDFNSSLTEPRRRSLRFSAINDTLRGNSSSKKGRAKQSTNSEASDQLTAERFLEPEGSSMAPRHETAPNVGRRRARIRIHNSGEGPESTRGNDVGVKEPDLPVLMETRDGYVDDALTFSITCHPNMNEDAIELTRMVIEKFAEHVTNTDYYPQFRQLAELLRKEHTELTGVSLQRKYMYTIYCDLETRPRFRCYCGKDFAFSHKETEANGLSMSGPGSHLRFCSSKSLQLRLNRGDG